MSSDRLQGPRLKVEWADQHIQKLETAIQRFEATNPYEVVRDENVQPGHMVYRFKQTVPIPSELALIAGDALHALRSALDHLWCQLVEANGKVVAPSDTFPISEDGQRFEATFKAVKQRIPSAARSLLYGLKPYQGGNDALWRLHKLDITDKHRVLLALWASNEAVHLRFAMNVPWQSQPVEAPPLTVQPQFRCLKDGDPLIIRGPTIGQPFGLPQPERDPQFEVAVALHEPPVVECEPLLPTVNQLRGEVSAVVELFAAFLAE
jgi:hypothetical protein